MPTGTPKRKKPSPRIKRTDPQQSARFIKAAQELGLDDKAGEAFDKAMDSLTKAKKPASS